MKITAFSAISLFFTTAISSVLITPAFANPNESYSSWIDNEVLAQDHRAYCDDEVGRNTYADTGRVSNQSNNTRSSNIRNSQRSSTSRTREQNIRHRGILSRSSVNNSRKDTGTQERSSSAQNNNSRSRAYEREWDRTRAETVVTGGKNCSTFVEAAAQRDINREQQVTNRMAIEAKKEVKLEEFETNAQNNMFEVLMQGW